MITDTELAGEIKAATERVIEALKKLPMNPQSAGISAFFNGALLHAKIDALIEYTSPFELDESGSPIMKATFPEILIKHLTKSADSLEASIQQAPRIAVASSVGAH